MVSVTEPIPLENLPTASDPVLDRIGVVTADLDGIEDVPLAQAAAQFEVVHGELQAALADLDQS